VRDLAMLEVSALLHQAVEGDGSLVRHGARLYAEARGLPVEIDLASGPAIQRNTLQFVSEVRKQALRRAELPVYALMVFDNAVMQLGGLEFGSGASANKINNPLDAAVLAALAARWLRLTAPELFAPPSAE